ncbi:MAG: T9SS type A sorting domain-containing protein [Bacteroidota bacterium]
MKKYILFSIICFSLNAVAQTTEFSWVKTIGSTSGFAYRIITYVDASKNSVSISKFEGTQDFDPGVGTYTMAASSCCDPDMFVSKLDSSGNFLWAKNMGIGPSGTDLTSISTDPAGNIYILGQSPGLPDLDPGPATYTTFYGTPAPNNIFIVKLDPAGNFVWGNFVNTLSASAIKLDALGNIYVTGAFKFTKDFNPGPGVFNLTSGGGGSYPDVYVLKLDNSGNFIWAKNFEGSNQNYSGDVAIDHLGNVYTTGFYAGTVDFDPGPSVFNLSGASVVVCKLNVSGAFVWAKNITDGSNLSQGKCIEIDKSGNVYTSGRYYGSADFDPGPSTYTLQNIGQDDIFISKLDASGNFLWAKVMGGGSNDFCYAMAVDAMKNVYTTGVFAGTADFDPGVGTATFSSLGGEDIFISRLDSNGTFIWAKRIGNFTGETAFSLNLDHSNSLYTSGIFGSVIDFDPGPGIFNVTNVSAVTFFIHKMMQCEPPAAPVDLNPGQNVCDGNAATLLVSNTGTVSWYATPVSTTVLGTGTSFSAPTSGVGTYTYYASSETCTVSATRTAVVFTVTSSSLPTLSVSASATSVCVGSGVVLSATGANTYTWSTGMMASGVTVTPLINSTYTVTGTDVNNCYNSQTVSITVDNTCADVWPGDANSDGTADNLDVLELGLHFTQSGAPRATTSNTWQSYFANNWTGTITNGKNLNHSDCNGDGIINSDDTLAIYNNYGLTHTFKPVETTTVNPQLSIVPDQAMVTKGSWGTASIYLGDAVTSISNINGLAFTINFENTLIEPNGVWIEYPTSFLNPSNQNLHFRKLDFVNGNLYTATTHTNNININGNGLIGVLHYQILSNLSTDQVLNISLSQANQSSASGAITPLTSGTGTLMAIGASVGLKENSMNGSVVISPNPTNGIVNIGFHTLSPNTTVEVYNTVGALVLSENIINKNSAINISDMNTGMYFIKVIENGKVVTVKKIIRD